MRYVSDKRKTGSGNHKLKHGRRIKIVLGEVDRAKGCTTCTLSRCREGAPACNLTRITLAKRRAYRERQTLHAHSNAE